jgi:flavin reductase (DIM6/NTAB) family NADH-FMN oxidoreductase RutF
MQGIYSLLTKGLTCKQLGTISSYFCIIHDAAMNRSGLLLRRITQHRNVAYYSTNTSNHHISSQLRAILRETAQPVAVVTSFLPPNTPAPPSGFRYHGATLSSFTSIAMEPHPLVTFSMRVPSRMATSLKSPGTSHMVINLLSAAQASTAVQFSRPDLYPEPFTHVPFFLNEEGLPVIKGSLGALSCRALSGSWPLDDLEVLEELQRGGVVKTKAVVEGEGLVSELFIARVLRVEKMEKKEGDEDDLRTLPLLYHRRSYTTTDHNIVLERQPFDPKCTS